MKFSPVFRRAYVLVATGKERYSCDAILMASKGRAAGPLLFYREGFTPSPDSPEHYWLRNTGMTEDEHHEWRLTALCLAAAITKAEGI